MAAMHAAANMVPDFTFRRSIELADLKRLVEPAVIFEGTHVDSDGVTAYIYTVAGWLDGRNIATIEGGCTVGGEAMVIHADDRASADYLAGLGLMDTIEADRANEQATLDGLAALARLESVGPLQRVDLATAAPADKSTAFEEDAKAIQHLLGDGIVSH